MNRFGGNKKSKKGDGGKYFHTTKKGEIHELKNDLNSLDSVKVKEAVKKVIAAMTVGKDVSALFTDVVKSMPTDDIELKKLVYLYIINYARTQPDKAILVVASFTKDASDTSPLIRALAIRTMGCVRVNRITEYLCEPLRKALKDKDPYVRKTAAVCVAKLYDINAELVEDQDFLERLRDMISDPNPMVVANSVAALAEISEASGKDFFQINSNMLFKLLAALNECTEWGQVFILDSLAHYVPSSEEAENIIERVLPRLSHANSAVAMSAVKVIMRYLDRVKNPALIKSVVTQKLPPPLITLLSEHKPEVQYVALRNINLIVQKRPQVLQNEVKHFFCKYNDPIYVKMEKLEIMIQLVSPDNVDQVLMELKEYASEVDIEFVRKSVRAIGRCAIKLDEAAERCIKVLLELNKTKVNYVVQEAVVVIKDIFRKYPNRYESIIGTLCDNLDTLDEPEAKASMIWIIGEYASRIENAAELLEHFIDTFQDESAQVQLQTLSAVVKLFLLCPEDSKEMVTSVLNMATESADNPDLRDRGYVYWRLLSTDPAAAQRVVLAEKPVISDDTYRIDDGLLETLITQISTLSSVYHKPPESFVKGGRSMQFRAQDAKGDSDSDSASSSDSDDSDSGSDDDDDDSSVATDAPRGAAPAAGAAAVVDLFGFAAPQAAAAAAPAVDMPTFDEPESIVQRHPVLSGSQGKGVAISSGFIRRNGRLYMDLELTNNAGRDLSNFAVKFKKNFFGVAPAGGVELASGAIGSGSTGSAAFPLALTPDADVKTKVGDLKVALKTDVGVLIFEDHLPTHFLFEENPISEKKQFLGAWKSIEDEELLEMPNAQTNNADRITNMLGAFNVTLIAKRAIDDGHRLFMSSKVRGIDVLLELSVGAEVRGVAKSKSSLMSKAVLYGIAALLKRK
jgi:AP-1 complex subunit beta-1